MNSLADNLSFRLENLPPRTSMDVLDMDRLPMIPFGHAAFQYLNAACELGLLDPLAGRGPLTAEQIRSEFDLTEGAGDILLLDCTSLGLIELNGSWYRLAAQIMDLMKRGIWSYIKNTVAFEQHIMYEEQADFAEPLRQNTNDALLVPAHRLFRFAPGRGWHDLPVAAARDVVARRRLHGVRTDYLPRLGTARHPDRH